MIEAKETLTGSLISKQTIDGNLNVTEIKILPTLQDKEVTPTKSIQDITGDEG